MRLFDKKEWRWLPYYFKNHGRAVCKAPTPKCGECRVAPLCPSALIEPRKAKKPPAGRKKTRVRQ